MRAKDSPSMKSEVKREEKKNADKVDKFTLNVVPLQDSKEESGPKFADEVTRGCYIPDPEQYEKIEIARFEQFGSEKNVKAKNFQDLIEDFPYHKCDKVVKGVPLKHVIAHKCTHNDSNMMKSLYEFHEDFDMKYTPEVAVPLPEYFADYEKVVPPVEEFEKAVPLKQDEFKVNYVSRPSERSYFTPEEMDF